MKPRPQTALKRSCRHYKRWRFYFDGPFAANSPSWCPKCGAICSSVFTGKTLPTGQMLFQMQWTLPNQKNPPFTPAKPAKKHKGKARP